MRSTRSRPSSAMTNFERLSPLRRIPVLIDGDLVLSDSTVICAYLDEAYPGQPLLPTDPATAPAPAGSRNSPTRGSATCSSGACSTRRSSARWCGARRATRSGSRRRSTEDAPAALDYLETRAAGSGYLFGDDRPRRHRPRQLLPQRRLCRLRGRRRRAGRRSRAFVGEMLAHRCSRSCWRLRRSSAARRSRAAARRCSTPARS